MTDKYDEEIGRLSSLHGDAFTVAVSKAWGCGSLLFRYAGYEDGNEEDDDGNLRDCGCLTQIREDSGPCGFGVFAVSGEHREDLTRAIAEDERLPDSPWQIEHKHLPIFAEWQRRLDKELGRT